MWQFDMKWAGDATLIGCEGGRDATLIGCERDRNATLAVPLRGHISKTDKVKAHNFLKYAVRDTQILWDYRQNQHQEPHPNWDGVVLLLVPMGSSQWPFCLKRVLQQEKVDVLLIIIMISRPRKT